MRCKPCRPHAAFYCLVFLSTAYVCLVFLLSGHYRVYMQKVTIISKRRLLSGVDMRHDTLAASASIQQQTLSTEISNMTQLIQVLPRQTHIYSAFQLNYCVNHLKVPNMNFKTPYNNENNATILITGWERLQMNLTKSQTMYKCCMWMDYDSFGEINVFIKTRHYLVSNEIKLFATNFYCPLQKQNWHIKGISLAERSRKCPNMTAQYLKPFFPPKSQMPGIAICTKVAYDKVDPRFLVEWLEIQRFLGVTKVISYTYRLYKEAANVLKFYSATGFVEIFPFDYPDKDVVHRVPGDKTFQYFHDEAVTERDCQERTRHYKYAAVMDKDEIVFPVTHGFNGALVKYLDQELEQNTKLAAIRFKTQLHKLDTTTHNSSAPTNTTTVPNDNSGAASRLITESVTGCSPAVVDRPKNIYMPERIVPGSVSTHYVTPLPGLKVLAENPDKATLHHYRRRRERYNLHPNLRYNADCSSMQQLANAVATSTFNVFKELGIS